MSGQASYSQQRTRKKDVVLDLCVVSSILADFTRFCYFRTTCALEILQKYIMNGHNSALLDTTTTVLRVLRGDGEAPRRSLLLRSRRDSTNKLENVFFFATYFFLRRLRTFFLFLSRPRRSSDLGSPINEALLPPPHHGTT